MRLILPQPAAEYVATSVKASLQSPSIKRFLKAQQAVWDDVREELAAGRKQSHWMWFIFPQLLGLGSSETSQFFGISGLREAREYLNDETLGPRLVECTSLVLIHNTRRAQHIFGAVDAQKFQSSMTLFEAVDAHSVFTKAIETFYDSQRDRQTLDLLNIIGTQSS